MVNAKKCFLSPKKLFICTIYNSEIITYSRPLQKWASTDKLSPIYSDFKGNWNIYYFKIVNIILNLFGEFV